MQANRQIKQNVAALLKGRRVAQRDLAQWCRRSESWMSKSLDLNSPRVIPLKYWDKIADFFGIATYQLLQPGISAVTERRKSQRRSGEDRRVARVPHEATEPGFSDRALVREVLSVPYDERPFLFESIATLKRRRIVPPTPGPDEAGDRSGGAATRARSRASVRPK